MIYLEVDGEPLNDDEIAEIEGGYCINCHEKFSDIPLKGSEDQLIENKVIVANLKTGPIWWHKRCKRLSPTM